MGEPRIYRNWIGDGDLSSFHVAVKETDLYLRAERNLREEALRTIIEYRTSLEQYIELNPQFLTAMEPIPVAEDAPQIIHEMAGAAERVGVGPMAAVAGAIAEGVGRELMKLSTEVIVENGGDIFLHIQRKRTVGIYAGDSPFSGGLVLEIEPEETPMGICTSSGTVGHSISFGRADAVIVLSRSTALADAAATATANRVKKVGDIPEGIAFAQGIVGLGGVVIVKDDRMGVWGRVKLSSTTDV